MREIIIVLLIGMYIASCQIDKKRPDPVKQMQAQLDTIQLMLSHMYRIELGHKSPDITLQEKRK